jgi:cell division septation protein DedD
MNLPQSEQFPHDPERLPPARRRRARRLLAPLEADERAAFLDELAHLTSPTFDFFLFSILSGLVLSLGLLLDTPALLLLGALLAPFMAPVVGLSFGTITGSVRTFVINTIGLLIGSLMVFAAGFLIGLLSLIWNPGDMSQAHLHAQISGSNFIVLAVGAILTAAAMVHREREAAVPSIALAYQLYIPLAIAGFGLSSGVPNLFPDGLVIFALHLSWAALLGALTFAILGFRPLTLFGYTLGAAVTLVGIIIVIGISGAGAVVSTKMGLPTPVPSATPTLTPVPPTPTSTLTPVPPSPTPTSTVTATVTPQPSPTLSPTPTPVYAYIYATTGNPPGAKIRTEPGGTVIRSYLNNTLVIVLPDTVEQGGLIWAHVIIMEDDTEGWILQSLLLVATPAPVW